MPPSNAAVPEPDAVHTVADLAAALKELRLGAPRRELTDDLLSLRELSELTGVPRSTLCNAESGRVLPSAKVVFHVARMCGVDRSRLNAWVDARHRVARSHSKQTVGATPRTTADISARPRVAAACDEQAGLEVRIVDRLEHADPAAVMPMLRSLPPAAVGEHLAKLHAPVAAQHLSSMAPDHAAEALTYMSPDQVAECMGWMEPSAAQRLLRPHDPIVSREFLRRMPSAVAASVISAMPAVVSAETLGSLPPDVAEGIIPGIPIAKREILVASDRMPDKLALKLLFGLSFGRIIALFESTYTLERCVELLTAIPGDAAAGLLAALTSERRADLIQQLGIDEVGRKISLATAETVAGVLDGIATETSAAVLSEVGVDLTAAVLNHVPHESRSAILGSMPPMMATIVRNAQIRSLGFASDR